MCGRRWDACSHPTKSSAGRPAVILSNGLWRRRFGGDPGIVGKGVSFQGVERHRGGRAAGGFSTAFSSRLGCAAAMCKPSLPFGYDIYRGPAHALLHSRARAPETGREFGPAQADLERGGGADFAALPRILRRNLKLEVAPLQADAVRDVRPALMALFAGAGFVLLICCVNVANLLLARASDRRKEIAVRAALGASQGRILRQLLIEGLLLCIMAGAAGLALGWAGVRGLLRIASGLSGTDGRHRLELAGAGVSWRRHSLAAVLLFGLAPGLESTKWDLIRTLREAGRSWQTPARRGVRASADRRRDHARLCAGDRRRPHDSHLRQDPAGAAGIRAAASADVRDRAAGDRGTAMTMPRVNFVKEWEATVRSLAGRGIGRARSRTCRWTIIRTGTVRTGRRVWPRARRATHAGGSSQRDAGYFRAMGTRLIEGRYFDEQDRADGRNAW